MPKTIERIVGIDGSLTGCAVATWTGALQEHGEKGRGPTAANRLSRYQALSAWVRNLIGRQPPPELIVIEANQGQIRGNAIQLVEFSWHLKADLLVEYPRARLIEVPPTNLKKWATGKGSGPKAAMVSSLARRYDVDFQTDNEADAFGLYMFGRGLAGLEKTTKAQQDVYHKLGLSLE